MTYTEVAENSDALSKNLQSVLKRYITTPSKRRRKISVSQKSLPQSTSDSIADPYSRQAEFACGCIAVRASISCSEGVHATGARRCCCLPASC